ncbi:sodium:solute symporter [Flaviaesturariibacter aridisoli]|uniref:Sodium:solute symporter n=1 Tax=Flaviaesturariibacter aridisoli TaxID=2545761 RepID=A0A4R4E2Q8_9BACT|nr:sodium:solute symporter [Flaviaesturariibacter aridisoli]TCZ73746.1 sodium:solute symporter [Flaviaesturariibacter aridisoli]
MSATLLFGLVIGYFVVLLFVAWLTGRKSNNESFFIGNRNSNWILVAFGMIGTSLSGVTFVSVPGAVGKEGFAYFQIALGYIIGYVTIAFVLLPLYYRLNVTSIYNYLQQRLGFTSYKTGASFFILSRTLGATARLYLVVKILQDAILNQLHVPFWLTTLVILLMILLYTFEGGVKTIVYTDTLQTTFMLAGLVICTIYIFNNLGLDFGAGLKAMGEKGYSQVFFTEPSSKLFFLKQILAGAFITITMTGMDQEMMQKNISVRTLRDSQKNMLTFAGVLTLVLLLFLFLGGLLHLFATARGVAATGDELFPAVALQHMPAAISIVFIIALISALFPSADGAITALTSSFCIDILGIKRNPRLDEKAQKRTRQFVHLTFAAIFLICVMVFYQVNSKSMIGVILKIAAYTYGPLLGLFTFGLVTKRSVNDALVPVVCLLAPALCYLVDSHQSDWLGGFQIGSELLILNGLLVFIGLLLLSKPAGVQKVLTAEAS